MAQILIAEDDRSIRTLLRTYLASERYDIQEATTGTETLEAITQDPPPDIVLLDLSMPAPQGMEILSRLRNMIIRPRPRVIVLTANGSVDRAVAAMQMGAVDFLEKPCQPERLLAAIDRALSQKILAEAASPEGCAAALAHARRCLSDGNLAKAESHLRAVSRLAHHDPEFFYLLGLWHELNNRGSEAKAAYQKAAEYHREAREALLRLCATGVQTPAVPDRPMEGQAGAGNILR
jgi:DNA-binding NtrC family response regulator